MILQNHLGLKAIAPELLTNRSNTCIVHFMARPKEFDQEEALDAAVGVFREHGFAATSAGMLTDAMKIGRQSLYDTFGNKWKLYCLALQRYATSEAKRHLAALGGGATAFDGIRQLIERVVAEAHQPCLGIGSINEFGSSREELARTAEAAGRTLRGAICAKIREAQRDGDVASQLDPEHATGFLLANVAAIRISARGGTATAELEALGQLALRALR
jgi:AcrR family transcriptional regulator